MVSISGNQTQQDGDNKGGIIMSREAYLNSFSTIYEEIKQSVETKIGKLQSKSVNPNFIDRYYDMLANDYCIIGIGEITLNNDFIAAKKYFYQAAKLQEVLFQRYDSKEMKISSAFVTMNKYNRLLLALLSDSEELTSSLAHLIGGRTREEKDHGHPFSDNVGYAVKYIILDEKEKALENIENLKKLESNKDIKPYIAYRIVLNGIIERNVDSINDGLNLMVENHKRNKTFDDTADELISIPTIGFSKLSEMKGLKISLDDAIAPYAIMKKDIIAYPNLEFLL